MLYMSPMKRFNLLFVRPRQWKKADNFQRNAQGSHLVLHSKADFSPTEAHLRMKISCKFGEAR